MMYGNHYYVTTLPSYAATVTLGGLFFFLYVIVMAWAILSIIGWWQMYKKAGEHGWASLVPFYCNFVMYRISWGNGWVFLAPIVLLFSAIITYINMNLLALFISLVCSIATIVINCITMHKISKSFGHGLGYTLGLIFFSAVFVMILGLGRSEYIGPNGIKKTGNNANNRPDEFGTAN